MILVGRLCFRKLSTLIAIVLFVFLCIFLIFMRYTVPRPIEEKPVIVYEEDIAFNINRNFGVNVSFAKFYSVRYKNISFEVHEILFPSIRDVDVFLQKFIDVVKQEFTLEKITFMNFTAYKAISNNLTLPKTGLILQKDFSLVLFLGYTNDEKYLMDVVNWFIK